MVMGEVKEWEEGKVMIFDDTFTHEAWNRSNEKRLVLNIDIKRPEIDDSVADVCRAQFFKFIRCASGSLTPVDFKRTKRPPALAKIVSGLGWAWAWARLGPGPGLGPGPA